MKIKPIVLVALAVGTSSFLAATDVPTSNSRSRVTLKDAALIAKNFVAYNSTRHFPEWQRASKFNTVRVFSSDEVVVSYEVSIRSEKNENLGFVVVAAQKGNGEVVTAFSSEGESESQILHRFFSRQVEPALRKEGVTPVVKRLIGTVTGAYAIGAILDHPVDAPTEGDYYLFNANPLGSVSFTYKDRQDLRRKEFNEAEYTEELELRKALLSGDFSSALFREESSGKIDGLAKASASISGTFSSLYQEKRAWTNGGLTDGKCYAGCTPVAWAIVLEYWDRNGYPKMISTDKDNSNTSTTDSDVRWTIDELRKWLKTTCTSKSEGSTSYWNSTRGMNYAQGRGYSSSSASNTYIWPDWWSLLSAIDAKKPPIAALDTDANKEMDHSAAVWAYFDNSGNANDSYCVRTGWTSPTSKCFAKNSLYGLTSITIKK